VTLNIHIISHDKILNITSFPLEHEKGTTTVCSYVNLLLPVKITVFNVYIFLEQ